MMMGWSLPIGRIAGTDVRIHVTFFLLLAWLGIAAGLEGGSMAAIDTVLFILAVFACVLAHEFGHVLTARHFGIGTRDITLLPIGGVANIERLPDMPAQELLIAVAGPAVNVVIAGVLFGFLGASLDLEQLSPALTQHTGFATRLALVNVMLVVFNLLPAFPMDGGRMLRALLSFWLPRARSTRIAATLGQAVAFGLGFLGLFGNPLLIFIALFVFLAAGHEAYAVEVEEATKGVLMSHATITSFATLDQRATVSDAVEKLLATTQHEFPVIGDEGELRGVLTRDGIIQALASSGQRTSVLDVMLKDVAVLNSHAPLSEAVELLHRSGQPLVGIVDAERRVVGIITLENLAEFMMVSKANDGFMGSRKHMPG